MCDSSDVASRRVGQLECMQASDVSTHMLPFSESLISCCR